MPDEDLWVETLLLINSFGATIFSVFTPPFSLNVVVPLLSMQSQKALRFHQNILICVLKTNKGLKGLEQHEGE